MFQPEEGQKERTALEAISLRNTNHEVTLMSFLPCLLPLSTGRRRQTTHSICWLPGDLGEACGH